MNSNQLKPVVQNLNKPARVHLVQIYLTEPCSSLARLSFTILFSTLWVPWKAKRRCIYHDTVTRVTAPPHRWSCQNPPCRKSHRILPYNLKPNKSFNFRRISLKIKTAVKIKEVLTRKQNKININRYVFQKRNEGEEFFFRLPFWICSWINLIRKPFKSFITKLSWLEEARTIGTAENHWSSTLELSVSRDHYTFFPKKKKKETNFLKNLKPPKKRSSSWKKP